MFWFCPVFSQPNGYNDFGLCWPIWGLVNQGIRDTMTSSYGIRRGRGGSYDFHKGVDIRADYVPVYSSIEGEVSWRDVGSERGRTIVVSRVQPYLHTCYLHLSRWDVAQYDSVSRCQQIALTGESGDCDGPHLHYGIQEHSDISTFDFDTSGYEKHPTVNPLKYYPPSSDTCPFITNVDTVFTGPDNEVVDYITLSIKLKGQELDLQTLWIYLEKPIIGDDVIAYDIWNQAVHYKSFFYGQGKKPWAEFNDDSCLTFFSNEFDVATDICLYAENYLATSPYYILHVKIDPKYFFITSDRRNSIVVHAFDIGGNSALWENDTIYTVMKPDMQMKYFYAYRHRDRIVINYALFDLQRISQFMVKRLTTPQDSVILIFEQVFNNPVNQDYDFPGYIIDSTSNIYEINIYQASAIYEDGSEKVLGLCHLDGLPYLYGLSQNHPNPFNSFTSIEFNIPGPNAMEASLEVYNILGQRIRTLHKGLTAPGKYIKKWDGIDSDGHAVASGVYFYTLETPEKAERKKMVLVK